MRKKSSIKTKQILAFSIIIISILCIMLVLQVRTIHSMRQITYDKMQVQAQYYLESHEAEISHIRGLQAEFFSARKLVFLAEKNLQIDDYERREALLSLQEKLENIAGSSNLVEECIFYIPKSKYKISQTAVRRMDDEDFEQMSDYLEYQNGKISYNGTHFFSMQTGKKESSEIEDTSFVFVITFSNEEIIKQLEMFNTEKNSGDFIYNEEYDAMLEGEHDWKYDGRDVLSKLEKDKEGQYREVQEIEIGKTRFLVFVGGNGTLGVFVQYIEEAAILSYINQFWKYLVLFLLFMIGLSIFFIIYTDRLIHKPMGALIEAFNRVKVGNLEQPIHKENEDEFSYIFEAFNDMQEQLKQKINEVYVQTNLVQEAQLKQLQAQINPHFLYNSFFTLSRRIKREDYESAEEFAKHLGNYFRFLTRNGSNDVTLSQEAAHARSYAKIQSIRFAGRLTIEFGEVPQEFEELLVPRLILQPLLENSFEHGLENRVSDGLLCISFIKEEKGISICVEDNGEEATDEDIAKMQEKLESKNLKETTGIININKRLDMYFNGKARLRVKRSKLGGVAMIIEIEPEGGSDESKSIDRG